MRPRSGQYGAWELKTGYRRTAALGFVCAVLIHAAAVALVHYIPRTPEPPKAERLIRAIRSIPRLEPPGGMPTAGGDPGGVGTARTWRGGSSDIPIPAADETVEHEFASSHNPIEVLPHFEEPLDLLGGALLVGNVPFRTGQREYSKATVYGDLDAAGVDVPPQVIEKIKPEYPPEGLAYLFNANVVIRILIGAEGSVDEAFVVAESGVDMGFEESALNAVKQWLFYPAYKDGRTVPMWIDVPIAYRLFVTYDLSAASRKNLRTRIVF